MVCEWEGELRRSPSRRTGRGEEEERPQAELWSGECVGGQKGETEGQEKPLVGTNHSL